MVIPRKIWEQVLADFNHKCAYCQVNPYEEMDHFVPNSRGGKIEITNCLPICGYCNKRKSNRTGAALIGVFGKEHIETLVAYLISHSEDGTMTAETLLIPSLPPHHKPKLRIRELAENQGITLKKLAENSKVSFSQVSRYWNSYVLRVDLAALERIAKVLGVRTGDLIVDGDEWDERGEE